MATDPNVPAPTRDQVEAEMRQRFHQPQPFVRLLTFDCRGMPEDMAAEVGTDSAGYSVTAERTWQLGPVCAVQVNIAPGTPLEDVLARLDALRAKLVAEHAELLSENWARELGIKPELKVVKVAGQ